MGDDQTMCPRDGRDDRLEVEWDERPRVDHLDLDAFGGELLCGRERLGHEPRQRDDRHVAAGPSDACASERNLRRAVR